MNWYRVLIVITILLLPVLAWLRLPSEKDHLIRRSQYLMGTIIEIVATAETREQTNNAVEKAFAEIARLEKVFSRHIEDSEVSRLSKNIIELEVSNETVEVITLGLEVAKYSQGAFDMTLGRLKVLWGFDREHPAIPSKQKIAIAIDKIGPQALSVDTLTVTKQDPGLMVDLGGIAKGYAVDRAIAILRKGGVLSGAVNAGGDMFLIGQREERSWRIGIQHPRQKDATLARLEIRDKAVVTSGDYERFFEQDGARYHHIFDPATGFPASSCQSVTVLADSVALADALATALFVLGPYKGLPLLDHYPGVEALVVSEDGRQYSSPGWSDYLVDKP